jgi:hypothetical protein
MKAGKLVSIAALVLAAAGWIPVAAADTAEAMCEARKDGETRKGASGPCSFSQRQGYVSIDLRNGETWELSPRDKPNHFRDQKGNKVVRSVEGGDHIYKWEHRKIIVSFNQQHGHDHGDNNGHNDHGGNSANHGQTPHELRDLVDGGYVGGEVADEMGRRGYHSVRDEVSGNDVYSYYKGHGNCVTVRLDGRRHVRSIVTGPDLDCQR